MRAVVLAIMLVLASAPEAVAQAQYAGIAAAPYEFYEALVSQAADGDFAALDHATTHLEPLLRALQAATGVDCGAHLRAAIGARDRERVRAALRQVLFLDLRVNLEAGARVASRERRAELLQMAYGNYEFLGPLLVDRALDTRVKTEFRNAYRTRDAREYQAAATRVVGLLGPRCAVGTGHASR